jgi:hypothetical protein
LKHLYKIILIVTVVAASFLPCPSFGEKAVISDLLLTNSSEHLLVYFRLKNSFTKKMEDAILAGIPTTFVSYIELYQARRYWFDREVASVEVKHAIKYDAVKKLFFVTFSSDDRVSEAQQYGDFSGAKEAMTDVNGIVLASLRDLERGRHYHVRVKSRMDRFRLPLHMEYVFFFVSLWDFETPWLREDFIY